jgi:predicted DNA-binding protein (MmcQ/YjbR family)
MRMRNTRKPSMSHFDRVKAHSAGKDGAWEDHPWDHTVYKVDKKLFVITGEEEPLRVTVKAAPEEVDGLLTLPFIQRASHVGRYGWVTATVTDEEQLELVLDLIDSSYELIKGKAKRGSKSASAK